MNELERESLAKTQLFFRHGKTYFRAKFVKSRRDWVFYWLTPVGELRASKRYAEIPPRSRRLKTRPSKKTLTEAWLIK
jgi:hypothetical protein